MGFFRRELILAKQSRDVGVHRAALEQYLARTKGFVKYGSAWVFEDEKRRLTADVAFREKKKSVTGMSVLIPLGALHGDERDEAYLDAAKGLAEHFGWTLLDDGKPIVIESVYDRAATLLDDGKHEAAIPLFKKALELDPSDLYAWHNLAHCYEVLDRHDEALATFSRLVKIDPKNSEGWVGVANALSGQKKYDEALKAVTKAIGFDDKSALAWMNSGYYLNMLGRHDEALKRLEKAAKLDPEDAFIIYNVACTHSHRRDEEKCLGALAKAFEMDPNLKSDAPKEPELEWIRKNPRFADLCRK